MGPGIRVPGNVTSTHSPGLPSSGLQWGPGFASRETPDDPGSVRLDFGLQWGPGFASRETSTLKSLFAAQPELQWGPGFASRETRTGAPPPARSHGFNGARDSRPGKRPETHQVDVSPTGEASMGPGIRVPGNPTVAACWSAVIGFNGARDSRPGKRSSSRVSDPRGSASFNGARDSRPGKRPDRGERASPGCASMGPGIRVPGNSHRTRPGHAHDLQTASMGPGIRVPGNSGRRSRG